MEISAILGLIDKELKLDKKKIKEKARTIIKGNMWNLLKPYIYYLGIQLILSSFITLVPGNIFKINITEIQGTNIEVNPWLLLLTPISVGITHYYLKFIRNKTCDIKDVFSFYKLFVIIIIAEILKYIIISIGTAFFIIPGLILSIMFAMINYVISDGTHDVLDIFKQSAKIINGYKLDYFKFNLSFIWWMLFGILTFGIGYIYVIPYYGVANALYYEELKKIK